MSPIFDTEDEDEDTDYKYFSDGEDNSISIHPKENKEALIKIHIGNRDFRRTKMTKEE